MKINPISVAFVLPCLNEARTIEWCIERASQALELINQRFGLSGEVIVADNGSTDGSQELAERAGARVVAVSEKGYGAALLGGFDAAKADYLIMGDSDCSYDFVEAIPMVEKLLEGADVCMGSRFDGEIKPGAMPWKNRYICNPALSSILRFLFNTNIRDAHCGIRALTRDAYDRLKLSSTGMEFASEMVLKSVLLKLKLAEIPVTLSPDQRGRPPHLSPWRDGFRHLTYMFLLSPGWLFMAPAALMFILGSAVLGLLVAAGGSEIVWLGNLRFGDHWAVAASAALIMSVQTALMGIFAFLYSYQEGFRQPAGWAKMMLRKSCLHYWLVTGLLMIVAGSTWAVWIAAEWVASEFGALDSMRALIAAATLIVIGSQVFFSGFLMSVISGNRSRHALGI